MSLNKMNPDQIRQKVIQLVSNKLNVTEQRIEQAKTFEDLGADSLDLVEIIMEVEYEFGIMVDDQQAEKLHGINEVIDYIINLRSDDC